jgi:hypothetical protein
MNANTYMSILNLVFFISSNIFLFQPFHAPLDTYLVHITCERVEMKKIYS